MTTAMQHHQQVNLTVLRALRVNCRESIAGLAGGGGGCGYVCVCGGGGGGGADVCVWGGGDGGCMCVYVCMCVCVYVHGGLYLYGSAQYYVNYP